MDKGLIRRSFSKYAPYYDRYCMIQETCARELAARLRNGGFRAILDIGSGTGNYTRILKERFPYARITAVDISDKMIEIARKKMGSPDIEFIASDAETVRFEGKFDLISSNAALQWLGDLKKTLPYYRDLLRDGGILSFSMFGPRTFCELNASVRQLFGEERAISSSRFLGPGRVLEILKGCFGRASLEERVYTEQYGALKELLDTIRYTGARGYGAHNGALWTKRTIGDLDKVYREKFGGIRATYQVFFCEGIR